MTTKKAGELLNYNRSYNKPSWRKRRQESKPLKC